MPVLLVYPVHMRPDPWVHHVGCLLLQEPGGPEEEQPQGLEMDDDFDGELQDVPEAEQQDEEQQEGEEDDEQRLEQQMGEGGEGEQVKGIYHGYTFSHRLQHCHAHLNLL
jgi:hypothetical protein